MLREAVASVLRQTYRPIEIIIVDDGSTDETTRVADELASTYPFEVRALHVLNGGPGWAREAGRQVARGEFIQYLDSDDLLWPLVENGWRVLFMRTSDLVQRLQIARRELALENALAKLDKYHLLILDDIVYVSKDQAETSVLFELIGSRYERRSMLITANQPFGEWGKVFPDQAMTLAAIDRLVHHATIFEMNVESYRRRAALDRKHGPGRPPTHATIKEKA